MIAKNLVHCSWDLAVGTNLDGITLCFVHGQDTLLSTQVHIK